jgi:serine/threonine protein kinase
VTRFRGTLGYAAPEMCFELRASEKCDVYSFGMLLLDVVRRGKNLDLVDIDAASGSNQPWSPMAAWTRYEAGELMELLVPLSAAGHRGEDEPRRCRELAERLCKVAFWCAQERPRARPSMSAVVKMLEGEMSIAPPPNPFQYLITPASAVPSSINTVSSATTRSRNGIISFSRNLCTPFV